MPRCRYVRDLPAIAAWVQIDRAHAGNHSIVDVLMGVMLRVLVRERGSGWSYEDIICKIWRINIAEQKHKMK